jgi:anionic cell wall polymer biosynthesis LytR-Cps2A-Psr (LCP) family protein
VARTRGSKIDRGILLLVLIGAVVVATVVVGYFTLRTDLFTEKLKSGQPVAMVFSFFGQEADSYYELVLYHPGTHRAADVHIPGNTAALLESLAKYGPVSALYRRDNLEPLRKKLGELTGVSIAFHVDLDGDTLSRLVDLLGGVELFIPNPVDLTEGDSRVLFPSGSVQLDGAKALDFARYTDPQETAIERIDRRQKLLRAILVRVGERASFLLHPRVTPVVLGLLRTNLPRRGVEAFVGEMAQLRGDEVTFSRATGREQSVEGVTILFPAEDGRQLKDRVAQRAEAIATLDQALEEVLTITAEVRNGTPIAGLARRAASHLQGYGIVVPLTDIQNADRDDYEHTVVLARSGKPGAAQRVAELLKCERVETATEAAPDSGVDVTVILGRDFDGKYVQKN